MASLAIGETLQARDRCGTWLNAKILAKRGKGNSREILVHFMGWSSKFDEWIRLCDERIISAGADTPVEEDQFEVDKILKERTRGGVHTFLCSWVGYDASHNAWVAEEDIGCLVMKVCSSGNPHYTAPS